MFRVILSKCRTQFYTGPKYRCSLRIVYDRLQFTAAHLDLRAHFLQALSEHFNSLLLACDGCLEIFMLKRNRRFSSSVIVASCRCTVRCSLKTR